MYKHIYTLLTCLPACCLKNGRRYNYTTYNCSFEGGGGHNNPYQRVLKLMSSYRFKNLMILNGSMVF